MSITLAQVRAFAVGLPDVTEAPHHHFSSFRVAGKIFVTAPPDEAHIHVFVPEDMREQALAMHPAFLEKLLWGGKVVGLRATLANAAPSEIKRLVRAAYDHKATATKPARQSRR
jgi:YjbR